ncbi:TonB-dependent receptor [Bacteroides ilei]|uniref:TonB-dependent receptor n=1 Tax=Bacteroides ilei TaxID=1907658 RepID=UPI0009FB88EB
MEIINKAIVVASMAFCLNLSVFSQDISLVLNDITVKEAIEQLKKVTGYSFVFSSSDLDTQKHVSLNVKNSSIDDVVSQILTGQSDVVYKIQGKKIIIKRNARKNSDSNRKIKVQGRVLDVNGESVIGATIKENGTTNGTITDFDGNFNLETFYNAILDISYVGYKTQQVKAQNEKHLSIILREDTEALDEVVVIGYGTMKKSDLTGAISSVKTADITATPTTNALKSLQGKVAGLDIVQSSGQPGSTVSLTLRGNRSLKADNQPLVLVDGIDYGSLVDINPTDIESIEVLKDISSTAIYGTKGANGVIIITTKSGKKGQRTKVDFNAYVSIKNKAKYPRMMNGPEYAQLKREAYRTTNAAAPNQYMDDALIFNAEELDYLDKGYWVDWQDLILGTGLTQNYEISMTGGTEKTSYSVSLGFQNDHGLLKNDVLKRYNGRISLDHKVNQLINVGVNASYTFKDQDKRQNPLNLANKIPCIGRAYDDEGNFILNPAPGSSSTYSPLCDEQPGAYEDNIRSKRLFASGYINLNIGAGFTFKSTIGIDIHDSREGIFKGKNTVQNLGEKTTSSIQSDNDYRYTWDNVLNYSKMFGKHGLTTMIGSSTTSYGSESVVASGANQASSLTSFHDLGANTDSKEISSNLVETKMVSFFGRINYKFNERYLLQASLRADGSSVLAEGHKWGYFPSASVAWRIIEENFMKNQKIFNNLKVRLSWGVAGNSAIDAYATLGGLSKSVYAFGNTPVYGYYPSAIENRDLTWEKTATWNLGLDFAILNNRVSGTLDLYTSQTSDLLLPSLLPNSTGFTSVMQNVGKVDNKGIEATLNTIWFQSQKFTWTTDWTFSLNREKIKELNNGVSRDEGNLWFVDSPTKVFYDYKKIGIWQLGEEKEAEAFGGFKPGDIKVADMSSKGTTGEGVFSTDDRVIFSRVPKYTFGITNNITFKDFDVMFFIYGRIGQYVKDAYTQLYKPSALENSAPVNYWTPENPTNDYPRPNSSYSTNNYLLQSSLAYRKASFVKIRDITLGYTLPQRLSTKLHVSKLRVYCSLNNFVTFTKFPNYDPESDGSLDFPLAKQVLFGINLSL